MDFFLKDYVMKLLYNRSPLLLLFYSSQYLMKFSSFPAQLELYELLQISKDICIYIYAIICTFLPMDGAILKRAVIINFYLILDAID